MGSRAIAIISKRINEYNIEIEKNIKRAKRVTGEDKEPHELAQQENESIIEELTYIIEQLKK